MMAHLWAGLQWFTLGVVPWWLYVAAGLVAMVVIIMYVPSKLGAVLGCLAAMALGDVGFEAHGYTKGYTEAQQVYKAQAAAEQKRLAAAMQKSADLEGNLERDDEQFNQKVQQEATAAEAEARKGTLDANGNPADPRCTLGADATRRLRDIGR